MGSPSTSIRWPRRLLTTLAAVSGTLVLAVASAAQQTKPSHPPKPEAKPTAPAGTHGDPHVGQKLPPVEKPTRSNEPVKAAEKTPSPLPAPPAAETRPSPTVHHAAAMDADAALRRLVEGNARFAHDLDHTTPRDVARRSGLAGGQHPFAVILTCADSRVAPELVFDQDLGDLFVIRVAGNVADDAVLGSMEYAVEHLGTKLVLVMGHSSCGAVKAAVDTAKAGKDGTALPGHLPAVVGPILPAVADVAGDPARGDQLAAAIARNVQRTVASLRKSAPILAHAVESDGLRVVGAVYDLATGQITFVPDAGGSGHPEAQATTTSGEDSNDHSGR